MRYNPNLCLIFFVLGQSFLISAVLEQDHLPPQVLDFIQDDPAGYKTICFSLQDFFADNNPSKIDAVMQPPVVSRQMSQSEMRNIMAYMQAQDYQYRQRFRMGLNEFNHTMRLGYEDFIDKAFNQLCLSDEAIIELWQIYLDNSTFKRAKSVKKYGQIIEDKIQQRNKAKLINHKQEKEVVCGRSKVIVLQQQEVIKITQERLQSASEYEVCNFDIADCPAIALQQQWLDRQNALDKTQQQDYAQYDQSFHLTPQTASYLASCGLNYVSFQQFFGTALQQQLHSEICEALSQAAILQAKLPCRSQLLFSVVDFAGAVHEINKNEQVALVAALMDVDWLILKVSHQIAIAAIPYAQAIAAGVVYSGKDFLHMAAHPLETCKGLGKALYFVLETAALNNPEILLEYPEIYGPMRDKRNEEIKQTLQCLGRHMAKATGPERIEALTRFGADFVVPGKIIHAIGGVCGVIRSQSKTMRTLERVVGTLEQNLGFEEIAQEFIQATEKLEVATQENIGQQIVAELMEAEAQTLKNNPIKPELIIDAQLIAERITQAKKHFSAAVQESLEEIKLLAQKYGKVTLEFEGKVQDIIVDVGHIFLPEAMPKYDYNAILQVKALEEMRLTGWHYGYLKKFEEMKLIKIITTITHNDCVYVEAMWPYGHTVIKKTLFPHYWSREQVMENILEAFKNSIEINTGKGVYAELGRTILGKTLDGIEIEIKLNRKTLQDPWSMATAYVSKAYIGIK